MQLYWEDSFRQSSLAPSTEFREVDHGEEERGEGREREKSKHRERDEREWGGEAGCLDYIRKSVWGKGSPTPELECSGLGVEYAR